MRVSVLAENTTLTPELGCEHGLSLLLECGKHKILFDTGAGRLFHHNAAQMGFDLSKVDVAVLSHGHYDHGGGLCELLRCNEKAVILVSPYAFGNYYSKRDDEETVYIGLDIQFAFHERMQPVYTLYELPLENGSLTVFSGVSGGHPRPADSANLYLKSEIGYLSDDFAHEQHLVICHQDVITLFTACAHSGILNIIDHCQKQMGRYPDYVVGGFHLHNVRTGICEGDEQIEYLAHQLMQIGGTYYTCHCTGVEPYQKLKAMMGDCIGYLATGSQITIE